MWSRGVVWNNYIRGDGMPILSVHEDERTCCWSRSPLPCFPFYRSLLSYGGRLEGKVLAMPVSKRRIVWKEEERNSSWCGVRNLVVASSEQQGSMLLRTEICREDTIKMLQVCGRRPQCSLMVKILRSRYWKHKCESLGYYISCLLLTALSPGCWSILMILPLWWVSATWVWPLLPIGLATWI